MTEQRRQHIAVDQLASELLDEPTLLAISKIELEEKRTVRHMRWFFLNLIGLWVLAAMILPVTLFYLTRNPISFTLFTTLAPPIGILIWITRYLFRDDRDFRLAEKKLQYRKEK